MTDFSLVLPDEQATRRYASHLSALLRPGDCILLEGELGAGKTVFSRGVIQALSTEQLTVASPTFTLVQTYPVTLASGKQVTLWHADLYRLRHVLELEELGLQEALEEGVVLAEWPGIARGFWPEESLALTLKEAGEPGMRQLVGKAHAAWYGRLSSAGLAG